MHHSHPDPRPVRGQPEASPDGLPGHPASVADPVAGWALLPNAVVLTSISGQVLEMNAEFCALTGHERAALLGQAIDQVLPPAGRIFWQTHVLPTLLRGGEMRALQLQLRHAQGRLLPVLLNLREVLWGAEPAHCWSLFESQERHRFEAELIHQRNLAEAARQALEDHRGFLRTLCDAVPGRLAYWSSDLYCRFANQAMRDAFAPGGGALEGRHMRDVLGPQLYAQNQPQVQAALAGQEQRFERQHTLPNGLTQQVLVHYVPAVVAGQLRGFVAEITDVSAVKQAQLALAEQHELMRVTLRSIGDAVITADARGRVTWLNPAAARMTGWSERQALGLPVSQVFNIVHEHSRVAAPDPVQACLDQGQTVGLASHTVLLSRTGEEFGIEDSTAPIRSDSGELLGAVLVFHDVSEQRRLSREMSHRASHDSLTGLVNRAEFEHRLGRAFAQSQDTGEGHALMTLDLDRFKLVNDACGHAAGDQLLQQVARLLTEATRHRDTLARLGGDEFGILMEHCSTDQALRVGHAICARLDEYRFMHKGRSFRVGASIGLVPVDARWRDLAALQQAADAACYQAKQSGRNRVHCWQESDAALQERQQDVGWGTRLQQALDQDGFELWAQWQQPLDAPGAAPHAELLLRLRNPDGSLDLPRAFLPAAERFHMASRIDRWVLQQALDFLARSSASTPAPQVSVNLSGQSLADQAFHHWAQAQLRAAGPAVCARLWLEVNETVAVGQLADTALFIAQVHQAGVRVALDNFGAGAASFSYLRSLQVDAIKIDGRFVADLPSDPLAEAAVRCFVDVARLLGLQVVAECVEQAQVLTQLRGLGVTQVQGHLGHRPQRLSQLAPPTPVEALWPPTPDAAIETECNNR